MLEKFSLKGKIALVTGAGRGIGQSIANGLYEAGADVAVIDKDSCEGLNKNIKAYQVDLLRKEEISDAFKLLLDEFKGIDILVNNAAITRPGEAQNYTNEDWQETVDVNLNACFSLCQMAGKQMIKQNRGGSIINLTSIGAHQGFINNPAYGATKGGVRQLSKALAAEWGEHGIRVNNLGPGYTNTPMNEKSFKDKKAYEQRAKCTMLGRWAEPEEMVGSVVFLASDASSYVTGIDLCVDGGWTSKGM